MLLLRFLQRRSYLPFWRKSPLQDDMLFSQDFLTYMEAAAALLDEDPTLWCISSWNDNGLKHLGWQNDKLVSSCPQQFHAPD